MTVDRASLRLHTPPGLAVPASVEELDGRGAFRVEGGRLDDFYVEDGSRRAATFVSFLRGTTGSRVGWWRPQGEPLADAPLVLLGSEGELSVVARNLDDLGARLPDELDDLVSIDDHATQALRVWFERWSAERARVARASLERRRVAELLRTIVALPPASEPWRRVSVDLVLAGERCALFATLVGEQPLQLPAGFEAAARALRERDAGELPEAGLWFRAILTLNAAGDLGLKRDYLEEPAAQAFALSDEDLRRDAALARRSRYWTPEWLARRLAT